VTNSSPTFIWVDTTRIENKKKWREAIYKQLGAPINLVTKSGRGYRETRYQSDLINLPSLKTYGDTKTDIDEYKKQTAR
jgi:hypothetical protein